MGQIDTEKMCQSKKGDRSFQEIFLAEHMKEILQRQWSRKKSCDKVETVRQFRHLGYRVTVHGECEADVTARTGCGQVKLRECGEMLYG